MSDLRKISDEELIPLLNEGSERAFMEIYNRYWKKLLNQAKWDIKDVEEAEDCVQEVFIKLWNNRANINLRFKLSTYLYRAVKNQTINVLEKNYAKRNRLTEVKLNSDELVSSADVPMIEKEMLQALEEAISLLPEKCEQVYRLSREEGKSNREISTHLDIAEKTVEGHITRALKHLTSYLSLPTLMVMMYFDEQQRDWLNALISATHHFINIK